MTVKINAAFGERRQLKPYKRLMLIDMGPIHAFMM